MASEVLILYCVLIVLASAIGGALPTLVTFTHRRIQMTLSLVSGVMLGVALLHLLPHAIQLSPRSIDAPMLACLGGLVFMFLLIRTFHFHQHEMAADATDHAHSHTHSHASCEHHEHPTASGNLPVMAESAMGQPGSSAAPDFSWLGLTVGLALHTLIDGLALAAAFSAERLHSTLPALGTFLAVVLHKPLDAMTITSLMKARQASIRQQAVVNLTFALVCPVGALLFVWTMDQFTGWGQPILGLALAFSAGVFLCISLGDLLPEVHFHSHDRIWLSLMLLLGVLIAYLIETLLGHSHSIAQGVPISG